ncbi:MULTISPECIES: hypothetical protein [unclassified Bradyrhizobium]|uniref:hypothetical protein n=1 Tax=unclassified Bradyrhizobium TaxID=2631580 RepID=UPI002916E0F1|nr:MULTISPECIES: hypothetical protein [unclassified Bradyrhizobium]
MRPPKNKWPASDEGRSVLLCAQLLREMLGEMTFESFRVYSLDTLSRLSEALALIADVQRGRIPRDALDPVFEEMLWSFEKDPIAKKSAWPEIANLSGLVSQKAALSDIAANIRLVTRMLAPGYKAALEVHILSLFDEPKRKIELRHCCGFYCSHLVNAGFSKKWIEELVQKTFFDRDMIDADRGTLAGFFRNFDEGAVDFEVLTPINSEFANFVPPLGFDVSPYPDLNPEIKNALDLHCGSNFSHVLVSTEREHDPYQAIESVQHQLTYIRALTYLGKEGLSCSWSEWMHVTRAADPNGRVLRKPSLSFENPSEGRMRGHRLRSLQNYLLALTKNFDAPSTERLLSSINTAALARTSANAENQLISLWSAVEVLLSEPASNTPRILHYARHLVPCICLRHARRQFVSVYDELLVSYKRAFNAIMRKEPRFSHHDHHTNLAAIICLKENNDLRTELCELCAGNPLALQRLFKLYRDYGSPSAAVQTIRSHESRVRWQVHRIYRARNRIVHSGLVPSYLDSLIMNLVEYYRDTIATIIHRARKDDEKSDIDQVVSEIGFDYAILIRQLASVSGDMEYSDIHRLASMG